MPSARNVIVVLTRLNSPDSDGPDATGIRDTLQHAESEGATQSTAVPTTAVEPATLTQAEVIVFKFIPNVI